MTHEILQEILTNSVSLEKLSIHGVGRLKYVHIGGQSLELKHIEVVDCSQAKSIYLYDFDLESLWYKGRAINLELIIFRCLKNLILGKELLGWRITYSAGSHLVFCTFKLFPSVSLARRLVFHI